MTNGETPKGVRFKISLLLPTTRSVDPFRSRLCRPMGYREKRECGVREETQGSQEEKVHQFFLEHRQPPRAPAAPVAVAATLLDLISKSVNELRDGFHYLSTVAASSNNEDDANGNECRLRNNNNRFSQSSMRRSHCNRIFRQGATFPGKSLLKHSGNLES